MSATTATNVKTLVFNGVDGATGRHPTPTPAAHDLRKWFGEHVDPDGAVTLAWAEAAARAGLFPRLGRLGPPGPVRDFEFENGMKSRADQAGAGPAEGLLDLPKLGRLRRIPKPKRGGRRRPPRPKGGQRMRMATTRGRRTPSTRRMARTSLGLILALLLHWTLTGAVSAAPEPARLGDAVAEARRVAAQATPVAPSRLIVAGDPISALVAAGPDAPALYAIGGNGLYRSDDGGVAWQAVGPAPPPGRIVAGEEVRPCCSPAPGRPAPAAGSSRRCTAPATAAPAGRWSRAWPASSRSRSGARRTWRLARIAPGSCWRPTPLSNGDRTRSRDQGTKCPASLRLREVPRPSRRDWSSAPAKEGRASSGCSILPTPRAPRWGRP